MVVDRLRRSGRWGEVGSREVGGGRKQGGRKRIREGIGKGDR